MGKVIETVADSIAVEILNEDVILIGKGNELHLFIKNETKGNVFEKRVLDVKLTNKVHGIKKSRYTCGKILLVFGEKEFKLLQYNDVYEFDVFYRAELTDWISCGSFINESEEIVILTAHSVVLRFSNNVSAKECCLKERISCTDKSTLYCSCLHGDTWENLVVFAGNAFGELLIWQPSVSEEKKDNVLSWSVSPLLHRIFAHNGVIFSIDYDKESQCLISTSDDRSVKWWKVSLTKNGGLLNWKDCTLQAVSSGYGHVARVFQGRIIREGFDVYALSVGEDSFFCLWKKNGKLVFKRRQQYGATIWNFAYDSNTKTIYTIGSTGNLVAFGLSQIFKEARKPQESALLPQVLNANFIEYVAKVKFLSESRLICVTNRNRLITLKFKLVEWLEWEYINITLDFKCSVMEAFDNLIAICGYKRMVLIEWHEKTGLFKKVCDQEILSGVIRTLLFFSKHCFLICDDQGNCLIYMELLNNKRYLEIPKCKEPWLTSAVFLCQQQYIVISNRQGNLLLYKLDGIGSKYILKNIIKHPHGNLGATSLQCLQELEMSAIIRSIGHDGALNIFSVDFSRSEIKTCYRQIIPVAWVEHSEKCYNNLDVFLGFNDNHFVAWCKEYDFLLQLPCGGGHRSWHYLIDRKDFEICLVFVKNQRVHFYKLPLLNKELVALPLAKRWHVAPCNIMQILRDSHNSCIAVTAGDDNLVKIHTFTDQGLNEKKELHHHISNIRAMKVLPFNKEEFLVFTGGGRAQLCVIKVNKFNFHVNELVNHTLKQNINNKSKGKAYNFDPETRLMSLDVKKIDENEYHVYVGCSDGVIRHVNLNLIKCHVQLLTQYFYGKCILHLKYIPETDLVLVGATDGLLTFFDSKLGKSLYQLQHHASGVNGLSILYNSTSKSLHVLSGGDDQAVSYTELTLDNLNFQIVRKFCKPYLHTAQVCACALSSNGLFGFTSGVDQVLNKIDLCVGDVVDSFRSCVADIKGVALVNDDICLLYGCGLQIYSFNS